MAIILLRLNPRIRNTGAAALLLAGTYLLAGLVNAAPVVQPRLTGFAPRGGIVVVAPSESAGVGTETTSRPAPAANHRAI